MILRTLGTCELRLLAEGKAILGPGKPFALLAALAAAPDRTLPRNELVTLLWDDQDPDAARHALRQCVWYLRKKAAQDIVLTDGDLIRLGGSLTCDRDALLAAAAAGDHDRVIELYAGAFVPAFAVPGGAGFEAWAAVERRRLLEVFRVSAESIIQQRLATGRARDAIDLARRLRDQDRSHEAGWRLLIEVCTSAGDLLGAKTEAEAFREQAERSDIELDSASRSAIRSARQTSVAPPRPEAAAAADAAEAREASTSLVGREAAFLVLTDAWETTRVGRPARVHITARPGLGKSRLLRELAARIRAMRGRVVNVAGSMGTREIPFAVAGELAAALAALPGKQALSPDAAGTLVALNPTLSTWFPNAPRPLAGDDVVRARSLALRELAAAVSFEHPVAILVDDLHWWDDASAVLLSALGASTRDARLLVVTTGRPEARHHPAASTPGTIQVSLDPLTAAHVEELVLSIANLPPEPWAAAFPADLWRAARGSPLLTLEMLQHLEGRQLLSRHDGAWHAERPDDLLAALATTDALSARLEGLGAVERRVLIQLAVAGSTLTTDQLAAAADRTADDVHIPLRDMEQRGHVVRTGNGWRPSHDEITDEILRLTPAETVRDASTSVGRVLAGAERIEPAEARRAALLLRRGGDVTATHALFRRYARDQFDLGDRRPLKAIAIDLFGPTLPDAELLRIRRSAPLSWRLGLVSRPRRAVTTTLTGLLVGVLGLAVITRPVPPPPDAVLAIRLGTESAPRWRQAALRLDDWTGADSLPTESVAAPEYTSRDLASPDLTRIASTRDSVGVLLVCVTSPGLSPECRAPSAGARMEPVGWTRDGELVVITRTGTAAGRLEALDWDTGDRVRLFSGRAEAASVAPDGAWVVCVCGRTAARRGILVFPLDAPHQARPLEGARDGDALGDVVWLPGAPSLRTR